MIVVDGTDLLWRTIVRRRKTNEVWDAAVAWTRRSCSVNGVELVGMLLHGFRLKRDSSEPTFMFGVVSLTTEGAFKVGATNCCLSLTIIV